MPMQPIPLEPPPSIDKPDEIKTYKITEKIELKAHLFFPDVFKTSDKLPAFVFFHPGGWEKGEPAWGYDICHRYASLGMVAVSFQYRLSGPKGSTPIEAVMDSRSAIRWTRENADKLKIDSNRLVAGGISAGGHLAACAAMLTGPDEQGDDLNYSPIPNALALQSACLNPAIGELFANLLQDREKPENLSPAHHIRPGLPPMCLIHGMADEIVPYDSIKGFADEMQKAGNRCELHSFEETDHFFMNPSSRAQVPGLIDAFLVSLGYIEKGKK